MNRLRLSMRFWRLRSPRRRVKCRMRSDSYYNKLFSWRTKENMIKKLLDYLNNRYQYLAIICIGLTAVEFLTTLTKIIRGLSFYLV